MYLKVASYISFEHAQHKDTLTVCADRYGDCSLWITALRIVCKC